LFADCPVINFYETSLTARSAERAQRSRHPENNWRKTAGNCSTQFISESVILSLIALLLAVMLVKIVFAFC